MNKKINKYKEVFNPILRTYILEFKLRWKRVLFFYFTTIIFALLYSFFYPYHFDECSFYRDGITYFRFFLIFVSCFFFSDIVCSEFSKKTGYIMFPKINKYKLIVGKFVANLNIIIILVILYYLTMNFSTIVLYNTIIPESYFSLGIAIIYTITLSTLILFLSSIMPTVNFTTVTVVLIYLIGFPILEQVLTAINQEIEPIFSLNYIGNLINHTIPGGLPVGQRWTWVYYAGDILPPVKLWLTPTIEMGILIMSFYTTLLFLITLLAIKRKEL